MNLLLISCFSINALLQQRQKDLEFRSEIYEKIQKLELEKNTISQNLDRSLNQKKNVENERDALNSKLKVSEKALKVEK